jgi:hypothetical protein
MFIAEHLLDLSLIDLSRKFVQRDPKVVLDLFTLASPIDQYCQIVTPLFQGNRKLTVFLKSLTALQNTLRIVVVVPEVWRRSLSLQLGDLSDGTGFVKDTSAD